MSLVVFGMLSNHNQFIPATISSKGSPTWSITYVPRLHPVDPPAANPPNEHADIALISTSLPNPGAVTFINGLLPVPPPVNLNLPIVHVRYDALTPPPLHPAPNPHLPSTPHYPPLPQMPSPSLYHRGHLQCPSGNVISTFSYVKLF
jgi:hypothetical protein